MKEQTPEENFEKSFHLDNVLPADDDGDHADHNGHVGHPSQQSTIVQHHFYFDIFTLGSNCSQSLFVFIFKILDHLNTN